MGCTLHVARGHHRGHHIRRRARARAVGSKPRLSSCSRAHNGPESLMIVWRTTCMACSMSARGHKKTSGVML